MSPRIARTRLVDLATLKTFPANPRRGAHGDDPRLRIVLAGYGPEHEAHMPRSWRVLSYSASVAYQTAAQRGGKKGNQANRHQERLWFSPHCLAPSEQP